jgi:hypothetical protein
MFLAGIGAGAAKYSREASLSPLGSLRSEDLMQQPDKPLPLSL